VREKIKSGSMGVHGFANQPKLTREYFKSRNRYVATSPVSESVIEFGAPSFATTSAKVVLPGTMKATSSGVREVLRETRTTLQPREDMSSNAAMRNEDAILHRRVMSVLKWPKSELQVVCAFG
jgi:penicillin V acylase-like amidase (Ntn superfamily)